MNFYKRHIGDYIRDTSHLSLLEHGIYTRLMDVYYSRESGIPDDQAARLIGARSQDEKRSLKAVLSEFFELVDGIWIQSRCDEEIATAKEKADRNRIVGKSGGRPPKNRTQDKPTNNPDGFQTRTQTEPINNPSHQPVTSNQKPDIHHQSSEDDDDDDFGVEKIPRIGMTPEGAMATALRQLGVRVTSLDLTLKAWTADGFTLEQLTDATQLARQFKPYPEPIPAKYLDKVLRQPQRAPVKAADRITWVPPEENELAVQ